MKNHILLILLAFCIAVIPVSAYGPMTFGYNGNLQVTFVSQDAGYNNIFGISSPSSQYLGLIHSAAPGTVYTNVGRCSRDTDVVLYITTPDGHTYYSNQAGADGVDHTKITSSGTGTDLKYTTSWEDIFTGGDRDYNDVVLSVECIPENTPVPEFPTLALPIAFIIGFVGCILFFRETKEN